MIAADTTPKTTGTTSENTHPCPKCGFHLAGLIPGQAQELTCPDCGSHLMMRIFPTVKKSTGTIAPSAVSVSDRPVAVCFFHEDREASVTCDACGRMLCSLCDLEMVDRHLCSPCLEKERRAPTKKGSRSKFENRRVAWDQLALLTALVPLLVYVFSIFTAPLAVGFAIVGLRRPLSLVSPRWSKARLILALIFGLAQIVGWTLLGLTLLTNIWNA